MIKDPKLEEGVAYMASLNPREPACFVVAGLVALQKNDPHLAIAAFQRAIALGTPQRDLLELMIGRAKKLIDGSMEIPIALGGFGILVLAAIAYYLFQIIRSVRRAKTASTPSCPWAQPTHETHLRPGPLL